MKKRTGIIGILIAIVAIGIGYAALSAIPLVINGTGTITPSDDNFKVAYTAVSATKNPDTIVVDATVNAAGQTEVTFTVSNMTKKNDTATLTYTITNQSEDITALLAEDSTYLSVTGDTTYFSVTPSTFANATLAPGATTTQTVTVTALQTPVDAAKTATITLRLNATAQ